ncbi:hypothetical protein PGH43_08530 [Legionella pneumophila 130b]|nr:hypothetical protein PGH43_08530 [Legionella pneumophila 130b]
MITRIKLFIASLLVFFIPVADAAQDLTNMPSLAPVLKNAMPAIVNVAVQGYLPNNMASGNADDDDGKTVNSLPEYLKKAENLKV